MKWKQLTDDNEVPIKLNDKVHKTVSKPTMTYGAECWAVSKAYENRLHVAEMRMLRWIRDYIYTSRITRFRRDSCSKIISIISAFYF